MGYTQISNVEILKPKHPNRIAYRKPLEKKRTHPVNSQTKWSADCMMEENKPTD